jgi:hypothetical protein
MRICSYHFSQAFVTSNRELELKMSKIQSAPIVSSPSTSGIADLRRELDEANQERVQVKFSALLDCTIISQSQFYFSSLETSVFWLKGFQFWKAVTPLCLIHSKAGS